MNNTQTETTPQNPENTCHTITVQGSTISFLCMEDEFILTAMLKTRDRLIANGCCGGGCGICKATVHSGEYVVVKRMSREHIGEEEEHNGSVLLCCVQPRTDVCISRNKK